MDIFAGTDEVVVFEPVGPEDEDAAAQETDYGNHVFMQQNAGFMVLYSFIKGALLSKVGVVKAWWEEREEEQRETHRRPVHASGASRRRVGWRLGNRRPHGSRRQREPSRSGRKQNLVENSKHKPKFNHRRRFNFINCRLANVRPSRRATLSGYLRSCCHILITLHPLAFRTLRTLASRRLLRAILSIVGFWDVAVDLATVPKTTVHKHRKPNGTKDEIGISKQSDFPSPATKLKPSKNRY